MLVNKRYTNKASILIPVLIVFFIIAIVSLSIIQQVVTGLSITSDSAQSHQAYQLSDQRVELFLNQMKIFDNNSYAFDLCGWTNCIPENTPLYVNSTKGICRWGWFFIDSGPFTGLKCYAQGVGDTAPVQVTSPTQNYKLSELVEISIPSESADSVRAVRAPLPPRISNVFNSGFFMDQASPDNLDIHRCTSADNGAINACNWDGSVATETRYNNSRYVIIKWKHIDAAALTDPQMAYFAGMEFRYYQRNSSYAGNPADLLKQTDLRWYPVAKFKLNNTATGVQEDSSCSDRKSVV